MKTAIIPSSWSGYVQSSLRVMAGLLFIAHGMTKLRG